MFYPPAATGSKRAARVFESIFGTVRNLEPHPEIRRATEEGVFIFCLRKKSVTSTRLGGSPLGAGKSGRVRNTACAGPQEQSCASPRRRAANRDQVPFPSVVARRRLYYET